MIKTIKKGKEVSLRKIGIVVTFREGGVWDWDGVHGRVCKAEKVLSLDLGDGYRVFTL